MPAPAAFVASELVLVAIEASMRGGAPQRSAGLLGKYAAAHLRSIHKFIQKPADHLARCPPPRPLLRNRCQFAASDARQRLAQGATAGSWQTRRPAGLRVVVPPARPPATRKRCATAGRENSDIWLAEAAERAAGLAIYIHT